MDGAADFPTDFPRGPLRGRGGSSGVVGRLPPGRWLAPRGRDELWLNPLAVRASCRSITGMQATSTADPPTMLTEDRLWRPEKAAWYLDVKPSWIYEAVRTGRLPCHRVGRHIRFTRYMLDDWLAEQPRR